MPTSLLAHMASRVGLPVLALAIATGLWVTPSPTSIWQQGLACSGLAMVATLAAWWATVRPMHQLRVQLQACAAEPMGSERLPMPTVAEWSSLVHAINCVLGQQRLRLEEQQRTLAEASHQLRTPLAVLRTQLQEPGSVASRVPQMLQTVDRASAVADELLARLKLEQRVRLAHDSAKPAAAQACVSLGDVAREAALEFAPLIAQRRQDFSLEDVPAPVPADAWMLGELLRNLLANAIRHTPDHGRLGIVVRELAGQIELVVWDCGGGIAQADRVRLFEPFAAASGGSGVGLGLSICRELARAMGADIQLFNRAAQADGLTAGLDAVVRWPTVPVAPGGAPVHPTHLHSPTPHSGDKP
ncbi:MAG: sensor histidine kinase [Rubrivivax sp.]